MNEYPEFQEETYESEDRNLAIRVALNDAYAFVEGAKSVQSFSAYTVEESHDQFIERVEGRGTELRPNLLTRIDRTVNRVKTVVAEVKSKPIEAFQPRQSEDNVNT